nr:hypothetical protein [Paraburkholderia pallida]
MAADRVTTHNLGLPRIGAKRELKFGLERYWKGESSRDELKALGAEDHAGVWLTIVNIGRAVFMRMCS